MSTSYTIEEIIKATGYYYDEKQEIFYSNIDAWQREAGYCRLYDEAAALLDMIIDCEPIYFEYDNKRWLIEFWKGQYIMATGCEIGIYVTDKIPLDIHEIYYHSVGDEDLLEMSLSIMKEGKILFERSQRHWWLCCLKLGEFSEPHELVVEVSIILKDQSMRDAFLKGLEEAGYTSDEIIVEENTVAIKFHQPHTPQPFTRTKVTEEIAQRKNKLLCDKYQKITKEYSNTLDKIRYIQEKDPDLFLKILEMGKSKRLFKGYKKIKNSK